MKSSKFQQLIKNSAIFAAFFFVFSCSDYLTSVRKNNNLETESEIEETKAEIFTVTFDSSGGSEVPPQTVKANETATKPENPTKNGFNFNFWKKNGTEFNFSSPITSDTTLFASWKDANSSFTITFKNGNETLGTQEISKSGKIAPNLSASLTKDEDEFYKYSFLGWAESENSETAEYQNGSEISLTENIALFAVWKKIAKHKLIFHLKNGGADFTLATNYAEDETPLDLPSGFSWKDSDGNAISEIPAENFKDYDLTADFSENGTPYLILIRFQNILDDNYSLSEIKIAFGENGGQTSANANTQTQTGFLKQSVQEKTISGNTAVEVKYNREFFTYTLELGGGSVFSVPENINGKITAKYGTTICGETPTKTAYTFSKWNPATPASIITETKTYKAEWNIVKGVTLDEENEIPVESELTKAQQQILGITSGPVYTLSADDDYDSYSWKIEGEDAANLLNSIISNNNSKDFKVDMTLAKSGKIYTIVLTATKNGETYTSKMYVAK